MGNYKEVIRILDLRAVKNPQDAGTFFRRGLSYYWIGDFDSAINDFNNSIELNIADSGSYLWKGMALFYLDKFQDAVDNFTFAIQYDEDCYEALRMKAFWGMYEESIPALTKVIELDPNDDFAYYNRGISYGRLGNIEQANKDLKKSGELSAED